MPETLTFAVRHEYGTLAGTGIIVPVTLCIGGRNVRILAKWDTGSEFCIFERAHGEALDLDIESGSRQLVAPAKGDPFVVFGHTVTVECFEWQYEALVYFAADAAFTRNVLGRKGWMPQFRIGVVEYDAILHLSHYND